MDHPNNAQPMNANSERRPVYFVAETAFVPPTDVWETEDAVFVLLEIAHLDLKQCSIKYSDGFLVVEGKRQLPEKPEEKSIIKYHKKEIETGEFCVKVKMNTRIDQAQIAANFKNGFLQLRLAKLTTDKRESTIDIPVEI